MSQSDLLNINDAAAFLTVKPATIRKWILDRKLEFIKLGGAIRIRKQVLDDLLKNSTVKAAR